MSHRHDHTKGEKKSFFVCVDATTFSDAGSRVLVPCASRRENQS